MFAGSVTRRTSMAASAMRTRVLCSLCVYSSSGNAAIHHLHCVFWGEQQALENALRDLEIPEVDPLVGPVRPLLDIPRTEQNAWYPGRMHEEARVAGCPPGRDLSRDLGSAHRRGHRTDQIVLLGYLESQVVRTHLQVDLEPRNMGSCPRDRLLQLGDDMFAGLARVDTTVHLDLAPIRHYIGARAAVDGAHREIRRAEQVVPPDRKSTRLNSSHSSISYAVFCLKKK